MKKLFVFLAAAMLFAACSVSTEDYAKQQAKAFTEKNCPTPVRNDMRTDSLVYEEDTRTLHFYHSLYGKLDNPDSLRGRTDDMRERTLQALKNAGNLEQYKNANINFTYTYHSSSTPDTVLFEVTFRPSEYNK